VLFDDGDYSLSTKLARGLGTSFLRRELGTKSMEIDREKRKKESFVRQKREQEV